jgi:hypothetical protein
VEVVPVWQTQDRQVIQETDNRSKLTVSTDEWGVDREQLHQVFNSFSLWPTVDAFASSDNAVCGRFFAKWPQVGDMTVNFFAQSLNKTEIYFCCPPVKDIGHTIRRLQRFPGITAILVLPAWSGHPFWSLLRRGPEFRSEVMMYKEFTAKFQDTGCGRSLFARKQGMDIWMGVWHTGTYLDCRVYGGSTEQGYTDRNRLLLNVERMQYMLKNKNHDEGLFLLLVRNSNRWFRIRVFQDNLKRSFV